MDETTLRQQDATLSSLKSQMELNPTEGNVYKLVDEIQDRKRIDSIFERVFPEQCQKEQRGEALVVQPKDFACMRLVHGWLDEECAVFQNTYALSLNKYIVDFCETTPKEHQADISGVIHKACTDEASLY